MPTTFSLFTRLLLLWMMTAAPLLSATHAAPGQTDDDPLNLRLITFNIRYAASPPGDYEQPWSVRGPLLTSQLASLAGANAASNSLSVVPLIGLQEVLHEQLVDVEAGLGTGWAYLGTGRDDGAEAGEYCPLLYPAAALRLLDSVQKWLSPTPDVPSYWPGAGSRRYVVVGVFEDVRTRRRFVAANTHLDNASADARTGGMRIVLDVIRAVQEKWGPGLGVTLSGDFNSEPGHDAWLVLDRDGYLDDVYELAAPEARVGPYETYTGFDPAETDSRIDFIYVGPEGLTTWDVKRYEVVSSLVDDVLVSDHRAVVADLVLKP
ncbi:hypothetical protein F4778DRAFT_786530 [Xylariomycetidae sp. FL2044]|nr:hypothetical protein F4778DRAFT_786530 [Xylariomycetidae sp. FL2044]